MRHLIIAVSLVFTITVLAIETPSQTAAGKDHSETPVLRLTSIPNKETYALKEAVLTKTIFTNQSDKILCFPKPEQEIEFPERGYLTTKVAAPPGAREFDVFLGHFDGGGVWPREKILLEIKQRWIKLPPNETYTTALVRIPGNLDLQGPWQLTETYHPPEGSFGGAAYRNELISAAKEVGCTLPITKVSAETITINLVAPPEKK